MDGQSGARSIGGTFKVNTICSIVKHDIGRTHLEARYIEGNGESGITVLALFALKINTEILEILGIYHFNAYKEQYLGQSP